MKKEKITPEDLFRLKTPADPRFSPDGKRIVFSEASIDQESYTYHSHLFVIDRSDYSMQQWTFGQSNNHSPRWSPDGKLAFISSRSGEPQLYVIKSDGGEAKQITSSESGAQNPVWMDEQRVLFTSFLREESLKGNSLHNPEHPIPFELTELRYKSDADGILHGRKNQLFIADLTTGETELFLTCEGDAASPAVSRDWLAYIHYPEERPGKGMTADVHLRSLQTGQDINLTEGRGIFSEPQFSPDGRYLAFLGHEKEYKSATIQKLWLYDLANEALICLTGEWDMHAGDAVAGDAIYGSVFPGIQWTSDSKGFYLIVSDRGSTGVYYGSVEGLMYPVRMEAEHVSGMRLHPSYHLAVLAISTPEFPSELFEVDFQTGDSIQLTRLNEEWLQKSAVSKPEPFETEAEDGWTIHGWMMKPADWNPEKKYPVILQIHGGPHMMYANTYFHEFQVLASKGYVILYTNPRGSQGYGQDFVNLVRGDYGGGDFKDLMCAVDKAIEQFDFINSSRLGVAGGSYGGFMTNWIVGHTNRFKAAVTQRSISNWLSFSGVSDIGPSFTESEVGGAMPEDAMMLWEHSPLKYAASIETPLLILHSEKDYRCPIEQAEQLYVTLKNKGKTVKFIRFPDQNHELSRSGHPKLRVERLHAILNWFDEFL
ncbi:S9 family peptidase [Metabacillus sp. 84]|uniref:S9 family peptidase n=1 Tax=Metabacillus sp. 84 TaxID=3404705 RepID=UPI003CF244C4